MSSKKNASGKKFSSKKSSFMSSFYRPGYSEKSSTGVNRHDFDEDDNSDDEPNNNNNNNGPQGGGDKPIKFKKKRKKPKIGLVSVYKDMTYKSRFEVGFVSCLLVF